MKKFVVLNFMLIILLAACSPSEGAIQTAMAETQSAIPTATMTPVPPSETLSPTETATAEPTSTYTPIPTETLTAMPTESPTATPDLRVILVDSQEFLLEKDDLPIDSQYYLPGPGWISPHHNAEILSGWGNEEGRAYLEKTGRIDGWWVYYQRGSSVDVAPEQIYHNIIQYEHALGAQLTVTDYNQAIRTPESGWEYFDQEVTLGDVSIIIISKEIQSNGKYRVWMNLQTAYRNYVSIVGGYGWEDDVRLEFLVEMQKVILEKLAAAELSEP